MLHVRPWLMAFLAAPGCLVGADEPTSVKLGRPAPTLTLLGPEDGETVSGDPEFRAAVVTELDLPTAGLSIDDEQVAWFEDGGLIYRWNTADYAYGDHVVAAWATDEVSRAVREERTVFVNNPPTLSIDLEPGAVLSGVEPIAISAEDDDEVDSVELWMDGTRIAVDGTAPFTVNFDTCDFDSGDYQLQARATDSDGLETDADAVDVTLRQAVLIDLDVGSTAATPDHPITVQAAWDVDLDEVVIEIDGKQVFQATTPSGPTCSLSCSDRCRQYSYVWDTRSATEGSHTVRAIVRDTSAIEAEATSKITIDHDRDSDGTSDKGYGGTDCDDTDPTVYVGATESCDGVDSNCDGAMDDEFDLDDDGYLPLKGCSGAGQDCDDTSAAVHPAAKDSCGDGIDSDCAGGGACATVGAYWASDLATRTLLGNSSVSRMGSRVSPVGDINNSGSGDVLVDACQSGEEKLLVIAGATSAAGSITVGNNCGSGSVAAALGDIDNNGSDDLVVAGPAQAATYIFRGPITTNVGTGSAFASLSGTWTVVDAGDLDGDGDVDIVTGGTFSTTRPVAGVHLAPFTAGADAGTEGAVVGVTTADTVAVIAVIDDLDADGLPEVALGMPNYSTRRGRIAIFATPPGPGVAVADADFIIAGGTANADLGKAVASAGDMDLDGYGELATSAPGQGYTWVFAGPFVDDAMSASAAAGRVTTISGANIRVDAGDGDGDGRSDLLLALPEEDPEATNSGVVAVLYGPIRGALSINSYDDATHLFVYGSATNGYFGADARFIGDITGDGAEDIYVGETGTKKVYFFDLESAL